MYLAFRFEGDIHASLECVPLCVRRKLDLAALKISLEGWQALARAERIALCHLPVDGPGDLAMYRDVLHGFCARAGVELKPLHDDDAAARTWNATSIPPRLDARLRELGARLDDAAWRALPEDPRYALFKLSDPKRDPRKLAACCAELGLVDGPVPPIAPEHVVCLPAQERAR